MSELVEGWILDIAPITTVGRTDCSARPFVGYVALRTIAAAKKSLANLASFRRILYMRLNSSPVRAAPSRKGGVHARVYFRRELVLQG